MRMRFAQRYDERENVSSTRTWRPSYARIRDSAQRDLVALVKQALKRGSQNCVKEVRAIQHCRAMYLAYMHRELGP